jgi:hypothetical protein
MKINYVHLCEFASLSENKPNLLGIFEEISSNGNTPVTYEQFYIVCNLKITNEGNHTLKIDLVKKGDSTSIVDPLVFELKVEKGIEAYGVMGRIGSATFPEHGVYVFRITLDGTQIGETFLTVKAPKTE